MKWTDRITVTNEDNMALMARYPDDYFDLAIVDPPYGIGASLKKKYHKKAFTNYKAKDWDNCVPDKTYFKELFRVSKYQIIWGANYFVEHLPVSKNWIVWDKSQPLGISFSMHEIAFCNATGQAPIFRVTNGSNGNRCVVKNKSVKYQRIHPTQKPVKLYKKCLKHFAKTGDKILDTHLGSGSLAIACHELGFELTACELDAEYYNASLKRFKLETKQLMLDL
jgi:site-specific DNA-methyltransferase (adenine-specific)